MLSTHPILPVSFVWKLNILRRNPWWIVNFSGHVAVVFLSIPFAGTCGFKINPTLIVPFAIGIP
jgi:hypothetical protein